MQSLLLADECVVNTLDHEFAFIRISKANGGRSNNLFQKESLDFRCYTSKILLTLLICLRGATCFDPSNFSQRFRVVFFSICQYRAAIPLLKRSANQASLNPPTSEHLILLALSNMTCGIVHFVSLGLHYSSFKLSDQSGFQ